MSKAAVQCCWLRALWSCLRAFCSLQLIRKLLNWTEDDFSEDAWSSSDETEVLSPDHADASPLAGDADALTFKSNSKSFVQGPNAPEAIASLRIFTGTWNVAGKLPPSDLDLRHWLCSEEEPADLYVIGFQEVVPLDAANVLGAEQRAPAIAWESMIRQTLNDSSVDRRAMNRPHRGDEELPLMSAVETDDGSSTSRRYVRVASRQMVGLFLTVWIRRALRHAVSNVKLCCVGCGLMGYLGNKGSVAVSISLHGTSFCFLCTHLTSGETEEDRLRRNFDVAEIMRRTFFGPPGPQAIRAHDRIIWLGDLNYRLSTRNEATSAFLEKQDWNSLLKTDQLRLERCAGGIFEHWQEGRIQFAPTYKYVPRTDSYVTLRSPAWCDRILWLGRGLTQAAYMRAEYRLSDHRPVKATFLAEVVAA